MYGMEHGGWMIGGGLTMLLWWLVPVAVVAALVVFTLRCSPRTTAERDPVDILKERYARGEIGTEEFEQMRRHLAG